MEMLLRVVLLLLVIQQSRCFKWHLTDIIPQNKILTFSERYMFQSRNGPTMLEQGDAYVKVNGVISAL